jgi:hypothetical protein
MTKLARDKKEVLFQNSGNCGHCNSSNVDWHDSELLDGSIRYDYTCDDCDFEGSEWNDIVFSEQTSGFLPV